MRKKLKYIFPFLLFLINQSADCQIQNNVPDYIRQRFQKFTATVPWEEIFFHTDREEYISGEDLWFNVYLIDRQSFEPSINSRIAYFELLNAENRPVAQKRILLNKGFGPGEIHLPDTLSSGTYTIRAYTNWMKNFLPSNCFTKDIKIYNAINNKKFTEGVPANNTAEKGILTKPIPLNANSGITMRINNRRPDILEISVSADEKYRAGNGNLFYLVIQTHGKIDLIRSEMITEGNTIITFPRGSMTPGINQITILNSKVQPVCERYTFNPASDKLSITLQSKTTFKAREKITLEIYAGNSAALAINNANISVSVAPATNDNYFPDLNDYMVLGTEFGLIPQNALRSRKISETPPEIIDSILLNVRSNWIDWETILSGNPPHYKYPIEKEDHFFSGKLLTSDQSTSVSSEFVLLCMPGREAGFQYAKIDKEGDFTFNIHIDEDLKDFVLMPDHADKNHKIIIESSFSDGFAQTEMPVDSVSRSMPAYISEWGVNYQVRKIYGVSDMGNPLDPVVLPLRPVRFYGKPDIELVMADYVTLPEMKEVFFELLPRVSLKKKNSGYEILIADRINDSRYELLPDLFLDGVKIGDPSIIANLDPAIVEKIDIVKEEYFVGRYSFSGILNVITKSTDFSAISLPDYMIRLPYRVVEPVRSFVSPVYSSNDMKNSTIPDFRNTLFWNPSVKPGKEGYVKIEFWTSDVVSDYIINVQGITAEGKLISVRKYFSVE
jgi:hypothetical protein